MGLIFSLFDIAVIALVQEFPFGFYNAFFMDSFVSHSSLKSVNLVVVHDGFLSQPQTSVFHHGGFTLIVEEW